MMAAVHVVELVPRLWYCARLLTGAIVYHCRFHLCFSCSEVQMSAVKRVY